MFPGKYHFALKCTILHSCWSAPYLRASSPSPDQPAEILSDYIQQSTMARGLHTHIVTYRCEDQVPPVSTQDSRFPIVSGASLGGSLRGQAPRCGPEHVLLEPRSSLGWAGSTESREAGGSGKEKACWSVGEGDAAATPAGCPEEPCGSCRGPLPLLLPRDGGKPPPAALPLPAAVVAGALGPGQTLLCTWTPAPSSVGLHRGNQVEMNMWEEHVVLGQHG